MALVKLTVKTWHSLSTSSYLFFPPIYKDFSQIMLCLITSIALCIPELFETLKCFFSLDHSDFGFLCLTYHKVSNYVFVFFSPLQKKTYLEVHYMYSQDFHVYMHRSMEMYKTIESFGHISIEDIKFLPWTWPKMHYCIVFSIQKALKTAS